MLSVLHLVGIIRDKLVIIIMLAVCINFDNKRIKLYTPNTMAILFIMAFACLYAM